MCNRRSYKRLQCFAIGCNLQIAVLYIEQIRPELTWRLRPKGLYPAQKLYKVELDEDKQGYHFGAFMDNQLVGVVSLFVNGADFQFRKFAVDESMQGKGIGKAMLQHLIDFALNENAKRFWCNARVTAIGFYLKYGFNHTSQFFSKNGFDYEILEKKFSSDSNGL